MSSDPQDQFKDPRIIVYCDGACSGNPGPGGWASIVWTPDQHIRELGGGQAATTNNQMELQATTEALKYLSQTAGDVVIYTDSVYVIKGITQWIWGWMKRGWLTAEGKEVLNRDYWKALSNEVAKRKELGKIQWKYVRGHTGNPGNERCDEIAVAFSKRYSISLYDGSVMGYDVAVYDLPPDQDLPEHNRDKTPKAAAFSYLSYLGGVAMRHANWAECERRVKGQSGAKFKKATSATDEEEILKSWGVSSKLL